MEKENVHSDKPQTSEQSASRQEPEKDGDWRKSFYAPCTDTQEHKKNKAIIYERGLLYGGGLGSIFTLRLKQSYVREYQ